MAFGRIDKIEASESRETKAPAWTDYYAQANENYYKKVPINSIFTHQVQPFASQG